MSADYSNDYSYLDRIRINEGADRCKGAFNTILKKDPWHAATLLNDRRLMFPCLYLLRALILQHPIQRYLNTRNLIALRVIDQIRESNTSQPDQLSSRQESVHHALKWILETGFTEEVPEDAYEEILDLTTSVLMNGYKDLDVLPLVVDLTFKRNRSKRHIHDLVWVLFRVHDPRILTLVAQHLLSSDARDAELAAELLNFDMTNRSAADGDVQKRHKDYLYWLEENQPYLYFTGESFQYSSKPVFCAVDLERKYLQKGTLSYDKQPMPPLEDGEHECMAAFQQLGVEEKKILSEYSQKICRQSISAWKEWLHRPVGEQIRAASAGLEGEE